MLSAAKSEPRDERRGGEAEQHEAPGILPPVRRSGDRAQDRGQADGEEDPDGQRPRLPQDELADGPPPPAPPGRSLRTARLTPPPPTTPGARGPSSRAPAPPPATRRARTPAPPAARR